jgi:hypothetical protein
VNSYSKFLYLDEEHPEEKPVQHKKTVSKLINMLRQAIEASVLGAMGTLPRTRKTGFSRFCAMGT